MQLIKAEDYGLQQNKAKEIQSMFQPMLDKMVDLEKKYNEIVNLPMSEETSACARALRLEYVKVRTGTAKIHKELKDFYLKGGRFVDGWKNAQIMASQGIEEKLMAIEKYFENLEKERIAKIYEKRKNELLKYCNAESIPDNLGTLEDDLWNTLLLGAKTNYELIEEAKRKAEKERKELEIKESIYQTRRLELATYSDLGVNFDLTIETTNEEYSDIIKKCKHIKKEREEEVKKIRIENEKLKEEKELIGKKLKEKEEEKEEIERKKKEEEVLQKQKELNKNDADKITDLIADLENITKKYIFESEKNKEMFFDLKIKIFNIIETIRFVSEKNNI